MKILKARNYTETYLYKFSEKPATTVFWIAIFARVGFIALSNLFDDGLFFEDDAGYFALGKMYAENDPSFSLYEPFWNSLASFTWPIGFVFKIFTPEPFFAQLISALAGSLVPLIITLLLQQHVSKKIALCGGLFAALYPSQILWSSLILKDVFVWLSLSSIMLLAQWWFKQSRVLQLSAGFLGLLAITFYLSRLRVHSLIIVCLALIVCSIHRKNKHRTLKTAIAIGIFLLLPLNAGAGIGGIDIVEIVFGSEGKSQLVQIRQKGAAGASTAVTESTTDEYGSVISTQDSAEFQKEICYKEYESEKNNSAHASSSEEKLEECISLINFSNSGLVEDIIYFPVGLRVMLLDPLPTRLADNTKLLMAFFEHILWYPLLIFSFIGLKKFWRKPDLLFAATLGAGVISKWALVEGNFGTAYRHRGEFVWIAIFFASIGLEKYLRRKDLIKTKKKN